jgi:hypothetical protein
MVWERDTPTSGIATDDLLNALTERIASQVANKVLEQIQIPKDIKWLTMKEAAAHIQMDYNKFTRHVRKGEIPSHNILGCIRINQKELDEMGMSR